MIVFVRHGQTASNRNGMLQGRVDNELTDLGRAQAAQLAALLRARPVHRVVSSPLQRATTTGAAIAAEHGLQVEVDQRLVELDYGDWDERPINEVAAEDWEKWRLDPSFAPPGGESLVEVAARMWSFCTDWLRDETVVAVSHVSPIKAAVCLALGSDDRAAWRMHLDVASVTRVGRRPNGDAYLASYNETAHLL